VVPEPLVHDPTGSGSAAVAAARSHGMSNAAVISGAKTASGHPVAVFGPQTGYFSPQLLMLEELEGPGLSVRGGRPTLSATHYLYHGQCLPMEVLEQDDAWTPTTADSTPAGSYKLITL